jgi:sulfhydrogenase subunit beta (sulfur reductase)
MPNFGKGKAMEQRVMEKKDVKSFIAELIKLYPSVYGPVTKGKSFSFQKITDPGEVRFNYIRSILPPKKLIMPQEECLMKFTMPPEPKAESVVNYEDQVIIGVHPCDVKAIKLLDLVMANGNTDHNYMKRREHTIIVGIDCIPDDYCYCSSVMDLRCTEGFDIFLTDLGDQVLIDILTPKGKELVEKVTTAPATKDHLKKQDDSLDAKKKMFKAKINGPVQILPLELEGQWDAQVWEDMGHKCLSCGQCVIACPTCYCFDVEDKLSLDLKSGERVRKWDGCQLADFAYVGSGENFREEASGRIRHRFHRKFKYHIDSYSHTFCTGCGRCWYYCPVDINLVEISNRILAREVKCNP